MRLLVLAMLVCFLVPVCASGCGGGGSSSVSCASTFKACGGDVTGTWTYADTCNPLPMTVSNCPSAKVSATTSVTGTIDFNADKTYSSALTVVQAGTITAPLSCLLATSCSAASSMTMMNGQTVKITCTGTTTCNCSVTDTQNLDATGTYTKSGNNLTATPKGGSAVPVPYCVNGSELDLGGALVGTGAANTYVAFTM